MGVEAIQVLPLSAFEGGELRALKDAADLLHGLVREGAQILRGNRAQPVTSFAQAHAWLLEEAKKGRQIPRFKGLGEMNPEQLWETTVNPETRRLLAVRIEDAGAADRIFSTLMGDVVEPRREFIEDNALKVSNLAIGPGGARRSRRPGGGARRGAAVAGACGIRRAARRSRHTVAAITP